jgi:hypothetical protein
MSEKRDKNVKKLLMNSKPSKDKLSDEVVEMITDITYDGPLKNVKVE